MTSRRDEEPPARPNLFGMDRDELARRLRDRGAPEFHAGQIHRWLYERRSFETDRWTDLPTSLREWIAAEMRIDPGRIAGATEAADGTVKYRVALAGGDVVEAVYMVQSQRVTLCVSSQVGCALDCAFCLTGRMGLVRHLDAGEILGQIALIRCARALDDQPYNVVFMGMGEPLHNYDQVLGAFRLLTGGFGLSRRRVTVSTSGLVPAIERLAREPLRPRLAVSLNATTDSIRDRIMPVNRKYPIARLLEACRAYGETTGDRLTLEYVLLAGVNDSPDDVRRLARLVRSVPAKLNLIPFNPVPGWLDYRPASRRRVIAIRDQLLQARVPVSIRFSRGAEARAACGQLALLPKEGDPA